jgi:activator of 2-hydroxyglutaryl-CoA dehydratase
LQSGIEIGIFGLIVLLFLLFKGITIAWKNRNYLLLFVVLNLAFNMLFESMLQRQSGIIFYTFWITFFVAFGAYFTNENKEKAL